MTQTMDLRTVFDVRSEGGDFDKIAVPDYIATNLKHELRPYQTESIKRFLYYFDGYKNSPEQKHLLYQMATGSGKTLLMAALMLELYNRGYRDFLFFVNSGNIIEKTRDNFVNPLSAKYLFANHIKIDDKSINIRSVDNFDESNPDDINICFTTIQGLHSRINAPRESAITEEDFVDKKIVMLADEAHHINAWTKGALGKDEEESKYCWEGTIGRIFDRNAHNIMLEFTATIDMDNPDIARKYSDKLIYNYDLKQFRLDKYSKEIIVLEADIRPIDRVLQAMILSQYRVKIAEANGIFLKPVILLKSKTIKESLEFHDEFFSMLATLSAKDLEILKNHATGKIKEVFDYISDSRITMQNFVLELQNDFSESHAISINSRVESEDAQILVNTLEDKKNPVRLIFAVDKLDEGWDVLNLFDIVRLYDTRDGKNGNPGKTTIREAQLIGRGARYCPFADKSKPETDNQKRKYDSERENPLSILETLYYHSARNPRYIDEIKKALRDSGIYAEATKIPVMLKNTFKNTDLYRNGIVWQNEKIKNLRQEKKVLKDYWDYGEATIHSGLKFTHNTNYENAVMRDDPNTDIKQNIIDLTLKISDLGVPAIWYAIDNLSFFSFDNLRVYLPTLPSLKMFMDRDLPEIVIKFSGHKERLDTLSPKDLRVLAFYALKFIRDKILDNDSEFKGTTEFKPKSIKSVFTDKVLTRKADDNSESIKGFAQSAIAGIRNISLFDKEWYCYEDNFGTSEEKELIAYFSGKADLIKEYFSEFYLMRNEDQFKIYNFDDGRATQPDFLLFVKDVSGDRPNMYQIFIEPKGEHLMATDQWKEDFLLKIEKRATTSFAEINNTRYKLIGEPFYNKELKERAFDAKLMADLGIKD